MITLSCSACHGTIARDVELEASSPTLIVFRMALKCPHCKHPNKVEIKTHLARAIWINGSELAPGTGEPTESSVRTL